MKTPLQQSIQGRKLTLEFSGEVMLRDFESKVSVIPEVEGTWEAINSHTIVFTITEAEVPKELWVRFEGSWKDQWRRSFNPPKARQFWLIESLPSLTKMIPEPGSVLKGQASLTFYWDKTLPFLAHQAGDLNDFVTINPSIVGSWETLGDRGVIFVPEENWLGSNTYEVVFDEAVMGQTLSILYETERLSIISIGLEDMHGKSPIDIRFNQPFELEDMWWITLEPSMEFEMEYGFRELSEDQKKGSVVGRDMNVLRIKPRDAWQLDTDYTLTIPSLVRSKLGPLKPHQGFTYTFKTLTPFSVYDLRYPLEPTQSFELTFNHPVKAKNFWRSFKMSDGGDPKTWGNDDPDKDYNSSRFWIEPPMGGWDPEKTYKLFLDEELKDIYGQKLPEVKMWLYEPVVNRFLSWPQTLDLTQKIYTPEAFPGLGIVYGGTLDQMMVEIERKYFYPQTSRKFFTLHSDEKQRPKTQAIDLEADFPQLLNEAGKLLPGEYTIRVKATNLQEELPPNLQLEKTFYVSDFSVLWDQFASHALVDRFEDGPADDFKKVDILLVDAQEKTQRYEAVSLPFKLESLAKKIFLQDGNQVGIVLPQLPPIPPQPYRWHWVTDKSFYASGDTLYAQGWFKGLDLQSSEETFTDIGPLGYRFDLWKNGEYLTTLTKGNLSKNNFQTEMLLENLAKGTYQLKLLLATGGQYDFVDETVITLGEHPSEMVIGNTEKEYFTLLPQKHQYRPKEKMVLEGDITSQDGQGVKRKNIVVELLREEELITREKIETFRRGGYRFPLIVPSEPGGYQIVFKTAEKEGLVIRDTFDFVVVGDEGLVWSSDHWALVNAQEMYRLGDTAEIFLGHPKNIEITQIKASLNRDGVLVPINFDETTYQTWIKIQPWMLPSTDLSLWVEAEKEGEKLIKHLKIPLLVSPLEHDLAVNLSLEKEQYLPGENARIKVQTSQDGVPLKSDMTFYVQYAEQPFDKIDAHFESFYRPFTGLSAHQQTQGIYFAPKDGVIQPSHVSLAKEGTTHLVRSLVTDDIGNGVLEFPIPPKAPYWRAIAVGQSGNSLGSGAINFKVPLSLNVKVEAPSFMRVGDLTQVSFDINIPDPQEILKLDMVLRGPDGVKIDYPNQSIRIWDQKKIVFGIQASRDFWYEFFTHKEEAQSLLFQLSVTSTTGLRAGEVFNIPLYPSLKTTSHIEKEVRDVLHVAYPPKQPWQEQVQFVLESQAPSEVPFEITAWKPEGYEKTLYQSGSLGDGPVIGSFVPERREGMKGLAFTSQSLPYKAEIWWHQYFLSENLDPVFGETWIERQYFKADDEGFYHPVESFQVGQTYKARVRFSTSVRQEAVNITDFLPGGVKLGDLLIQEANPYCSKWCGFKNIGDPEKADHISLNLKDLVPRTYEFVYTFEALNAGDYEGFPPTMVNIKDQNLLSHGEGRRIVIERP